MASLKNKKAAQEKARKEKMDAAAKGERDRQDDLFGNDEDPVPAVITKSKTENKTETSIRRSPGGPRKAVKKDKAVSLRFNGKLWEDFKRITDYYGTPATVAINQFVVQYVREKKELHPEIFTTNEVE